MKGLKWKLKKEEEEGKGSELGGGGEQKIQALDRSE